MALLPLKIVNFLNTAYDYLSPPATPHSQPLPLSREPSTLTSRLDAACQSPTSSLAHLSPDSMRRELDITKHDLARAHSDSIRFEERCKMLEKTLKETRELLRSREAEIEKLRRERDRERAMAERRRSDVGPQYQSQQQVQPAGYSRSLDTRTSSYELSRQIHSNRVHLQGADVRRDPSPSCNSSTSTSTSTTSTSLSSVGVSPTTNGQGNGHTNGHANGNGTEEDRARLRSAETYMTRTDSWSGAQVLQAVHDLNSEILQFAASATEMCNFDSTAPPNARLAQIVQDTNARIGPNITSILSNRDHSQDPLLVQLALQGCVSLCIARALNSFCIGFPSKSDAVLGQIYNHIHLSEPQPTSAKWRALTHQHIHSIYPTLTDYSINELSDTILRWCADIFIIANCHSFSTPSPVQSPENSTHPPASSQTQTQNPAAQLRALYLDQIRRISRAVMRLASVTREDIMSTSFEVVIADPSASFVEGDMVDAFGNYSQSHGCILVTMELGLKCVTRVSALADEALLNGNGKASHGANGHEAMVSRAEGGDGVLESRLLLQPKVVLESVLEVLDR